MLYPLNHTKATEQDTLTFLELVCVCLHVTYLWFVGAKES